MKRCRCEKMNPSFTKKATSCRPPHLFYSGMYRDMYVAQWYPLPSSHHGCSRWLWQYLAPEYLHLSWRPMRARVRSVGVDTNIRRVDARFAPNQWETALLCNDVSHWLGANIGSARIRPWRNEIVTLYLGHLLCTKYEITISAMSLVFPNVDMRGFVTTTGKHKNMTQYSDVK